MLSVSLSQAAAAAPDTMGPITSSTSTTQVQRLLAAKQALVVTTPQERASLTTPKAPTSSLAPTTPTATTQPWYKNPKVVVPVGLGALAIIGIGIWLLK